MGIMNTSTTQPGAYEIRVEGHLDERWGDWVDGVEIRHDADGTSTLTAQLADQPALHGVLGRMRDLGIPVVSVCRIDENGDASALMRAAAQYRYGDPMEVIEVRNIERPTVGADEVLVRVHAAGVDAGVWHLVSGQPYLLRTMGFGFRRPKNPVAGMDVAGTVEAVGSAVTRFRPGDEVFGCADGSFAEYATAKEAKLALKPANLTFEQAAAVPNSAAAALMALREVGRVQAGDRVLVIGASGGVGTYAVQIAKALGAHVTGVASTAKLDLVRAVGADEVIDYTREEIDARPGAYDLILDIGGNRSLSQLRRALTADGRLVIVGGEGGGKWFGGINRQLRATILSRFVSQDLRFFFSQVDVDDLEALTELIEAGAVTPAIDRAFTLDEAAEAVRYQHAGQARGKVVITL